MNKIRLYTRLQSGIETWLIWGWQFTELIPNSPLFSFRNNNNNTKTHICTHHHSAAKRWVHSEIPAPFFTFYPVSFQGEKIRRCGQPCLPCTPCQVRGARRWAAVQGHPPPTGPPHPRAQLSPARHGPTCSPVSEGAAEATRGLLLCCCWTWNSSRHTAGNQEHDWGFASLLVSRYLEESRRNPRSGTRSNTGH